MDATTVWTLLSLGVGTLPNVATAAIRRFAAGTAMQGRALTGAAHQPSGAKATMNPNGSASRNCNRRGKAIAVLCYIIRESS
jgi:hypothetical protein